MWLCNPVRSCIYRLYEIPSVYWKRCPVFFCCEFFLIIPLNSNLLPWTCLFHVRCVSWHLLTLTSVFSWHLFLFSSLSQDIVPFFKSLSHNIAFFRSLFLLTFPHRPLFLVSRDTIFLDIRFFYIFSWNFFSLTSLDVAIPLHCNIFLLAPLSFLTLLSLVTLSLVIWGIMFFS